LSYLFIDDVLRLNTLSTEERPKLYLKQKIQEGKRWYQHVNKVETPHLITSVDDLDIIKHRTSQPNYVTDNMISAPVCKLSDIQDKNDITGKIVMTEGADPGYDWIFLHSIEGLITKYGGAASHMTIRCAEFGLPAAIGCGEQLFDQLDQAQNVELNCTNKQIKVLG
jgi:phosphoenolpyruvate-protein kinase (PTS system EI component)